MHTPSHEPPAGPLGASLPGGAFGGSEGSLPLIGDLGGGPTPAALAQMADALPWPMMVLQPDACLIYANHAARTLLTTGRVLSLQDGRRLLLTPSRLHEALLSAIDEALAGGRRTLLQLPGPGKGYIASVTPLKPSPSAAAPAPAAAQRHVLLALAGDDSRRADTLAYAQLHQLSPAETRVLLQLAGGASSTQAARTLGVDASTVRSQILNLRRKTGHASVAALLQALNRMPPCGLQQENGPRGGE